MKNKNDFIFNNKYKYKMSTEAFCIDEFPSVDQLELAAQTKISNFYDSKWHDYTKIWLELILNNLDKKKMVLYGSLPPDKIFDDSLPHNKSFTNRQNLARWYQVFFDKISTFLEPKGYTVTPGKPSYRDPPEHHRYSMRAPVDPYVIVTWI